MMHGVSLKQIGENIQIITNIIKDVPYVDAVGNNYCHWHNSTVLQLHTIRGKLVLLSVIQIT